MLICYYAENVGKLSPHELQKLSYHWECYKAVVHSNMLARAEKRFLEASSTGISVRPAKIGRPSTSPVTNVNRSRAQRYKMDPKCKTCVFQCDQPDEGELHLTQSDSMGERLISIKILVMIKLGQAFHFCRNLVMLLHKKFGITETVYE